jgi:hypothetical protein
MIDGPRPATGLIASRLAYLFRTAYPEDRDPYSPVEAVAEINEAAGENVVSQTCIWQVRTGRRDNPTSNHLIALSRFVGVRRRISSTRSRSPPRRPRPRSSSPWPTTTSETSPCAVSLSDRSLWAIRDLIDSAAPSSASRHAQSIHHSQRNGN